jgi:hypothetical protein
MIQRVFAIKNDAGSLFLLDRYFYRRPLRGVFALVFEHHPYRALADFTRVALRCLHCSILSRLGASGKPGAVQRGPSGLSVAVHSSEGLDGTRYN